MIAIAKEEERLDQIVYEHYNTLDYMPQVLEANPALYDTIELEAGTEVVLPEITQKPKRKDERSLWLTQV